MVRVVREVIGLYLLLLSSLPATSLLSFYHGLYPFQCLPGRDLTKNVQINLFRAYHKVLFNASAAECLGDCRLVSKYDYEWLNLDSPSKERSLGRLLLNIYKGLKEEEGNGRSMEWRREEKKK